MALPPVEKTPVMLMRFTPKASRDVIATVIDALTRGGIIVVESEGLHDEDGETVAGGGGRGSVDDDERSAVVLGLTATQKMLEHEAEIVRLVNPCRTSQRHMPILMEHFAGRARDDFVDIERENAEGCDEFGLFTSAERALLLESLIASIPAPESLEIVGHNRRTSLAEAAIRKLESFGGKATEDDRAGPASKLPEVLRTSGYVDVMAPVHIPHIHKRIQKDMNSILTAPPIQAIRDYYGEEVAFYFAWMHHMTEWYVIPGLLGLAVYILRIHRGETVDNCELIPFFGLITFCWAVTCNRYWERREAELAYKWGTFALTDADRRSLGVWHTFRGKMRRSPITGRMEKYYPARKRRLKSAVGIIISLFLLAIVGVFLVISMNVQGYISRADEEMWGEGEHPLYFPYFAQMAEEGGIFDAKTWKCFLPIIFRAIIVTKINQQYSHIAEKLAEWENHESAMGHKKSVVLNRVLFEAFDAYIILFYLAIYERDVNLLRLELAGAFHIDSLRRILTECVLPYALPYVAKYFENDAVGPSKKDDDPKKKSTTCGHLTAEADLEKYERFDDFIEMLIQFGYVTLFASAYPLAAFIAIGANLIEMRTDFWKLGHLFRRVTPSREIDIGMWKWATKSFAWFAAISNLIIFAFTSSQLRQWLPDYYVTDERSGQSVPKASSRHEILLLVLIIEHCLLIIAALLNKAIPRTPQSIRIKVQQRLWFHETLAANARIRTAKRTSADATSMSEVATQMTTIERLAHLNSKVKE